MAYFDTAQDRKLKELESGLVGADIGITVQAFDADLSAIAALSTTGFPARTSSNTWVLRSLTSATSALTITHPLGVAGDPLFEVVPSAISHGTLGGLSSDDHPQYLLLTNIDDTPVNGETSAPISSNWAYDHEAAADPHTGYVLTSEIGTAVQAWDTELDSLAGLGVVQGDTIYGSAANTYSKLAKDANTVRYLSNQGTTNNPSWFNPMLLTQQGLHNIAFAQGSDSSQLKITSAAGAALSSTNFGKVIIRSSTAGTYREFTVTADVTIDLTGAHWGLDGKGNVTGAILRVYAADDNGTLKWGVGYQGGFYYIRNTQDSTTATDINLPEEILVNSGVGTDNSPVRDVGYIRADFTDASDEWAITEYHPNESADGLWQPWTTTFTGFSANPTISFQRWTQVGQTVHLARIDSGTGTSNSVSFTMTAPVKCQSAGVFSSNANVQDNSAEQTTPGGVIMSTAGSTTITLLKNSSGGSTWTAAGGKASGFTFTYEAYQP